MEKSFLQSKRVDYCLIKKDDIKHLENLTSDPVIMQYFPGGPQTREQIAQRINEFISYYEEKSLPCFVLFEKTSGKCIGRAGFGPLETGEVEVGYILYKEFWGQGFATEILSELLTWAEKNLAVDHIIAFAVVDNVGSWRVMEKCGMQYLKNDIAKGFECKFYKKFLNKKINFTLRKINEADLDACISLFQDTVHHVNSKDYSLEQLNAWAPKMEVKNIDNYSYWQTLLENIAYVAEYHNQIIGFGDVTKTGYLDRLYVYKDFQGCGQD